MKKLISIFTAFTTISMLSGLFLILPVHAATFADGDLVREADEVDVYIVKLVGDKTFKRLILNPDVFNMYGHLEWTDIQVVDDGTLTAYTTSELVRADGDEKVYKLYPDGDVGTKKWIESADCFASSSFDFDSIYVINSFDRDSYTTASTTYCEGVVDDEEDEDDEGVVGTEGSLTAKLLAVPTATDVYEDDVNKAVMALEMEAEDSDITIKRIDVRFDGDKPWDNISYVSLYDEDNAVKGLDVISDAFIKDGTDDYRLRFSGLNILVTEDTKETLYLKVNGLSSPEKVEITLSIPADGIRYEDSLGLSSTFTTELTGRTFLSAEAEIGEIAVEVDADGIEEGIIIVDEDDVIEDQYLLIFDVEALDVDLELTDVTVSIDTGTKDVHEVVRSVSLYDGADKIGIETPAGDDDNNLEDFTFEDLEVSIDEDATKLLTVKVDILAKDGTTGLYADGETITVTVTEILGEDANDEDVTGGTTLTVAGETQYLYLAAPEVAYTDDVVETHENTDGYVISADSTIKFTVKALGDDVDLVFDDDAITLDVLASGSSGLCAEIASGTEYIEIDGDEFASGDTVTVKKGDSVEVVIEARIQAVDDTSGTAWVSVRSYLKVDTVGVLPSSLLEDLRTDSLILEVLQTT